MSRMRRKSAPYLKRLLGSTLLTTGAAGASIAASHALRQFWRRPLRGLQGSYTLAGLSRPVEVIRDQWGVPHIYAQTEDDLFFAQGYAQAQDRLFQMDGNRRLGGGRLSELVGPPGLPTDRIARIFGWVRAGEAQIKGASVESRAAADAFARGVNAFINQGNWPVEYALLACRPQPWEPLHSALWGAVLAWGLSANWETELGRALLVEKLGPEKTADLTLTYDDSYQTILPSVRVGARLLAAMMDAYREAMRYLPLGYVPGGPNVGSNNWVVNGQWTRSGRPVLANDPHLAAIFPTLWYENHLVGGRYNVTGFTSPGVPGVIIGHNEHVAWGITNAFPDVMDIFLEQVHPDDPTLVREDDGWVKMTMRREEIKVRGRRQPLVLDVPYTRHGPVVSELIPGEHRTFSLQWNAFAPADHLQALLLLARATDWSSFREGLQAWGFPPQNVVYADVAGHIGYMMPGLVPIRPRGEGLVPAPGWDTAYDWQGWIPFAEMPTQYDPIEGYVVTANNRVVGDGYPHWLTAEWLPHYRSDRIIELIKMRAPLSLADHAAIQADAVSLFARRFQAVALPLLRAEPPATRLAACALTVLSAWDGTMDAQRVEPSLFFALFTCYVESVVTQAVGSLSELLLGDGFLEGFPSNSFYNTSVELALRWLEMPAPGWVGDARALLVPSLTRALALLEATYGPDPACWTWGRLHQVRLHNHLSRIPGLGKLWKPITLPMNGDSFTVNQAGMTPYFPPRPIHSIASSRMILDVGAWDNSLSVLPGGQSGHPASAHYQDGITDWHAHRYHPMLFSREKVEAAAARRLTLHPASATAVAESSAVSAAYD